MQISTHELITAGWHSTFIEEKIIYEEITADSRKVDDKTIFFAFDGQKSKGKDFVLGALFQGAPAIFVDTQYRKEIIDELKKLNYEIKNAPLFFADNYLSRAGSTVSLLNGNPSKKIAGIAVTGTNGKTTTAWAIYKTLKRMGKRPSYVGTIGIELPEESSVAVLTTPPLIDVHRILRQAFDQRGDTAIFETSSHGLKQGRLEGIEWKIGLFTNLTEDHRDYHITMEDYYLSKRILFENLLRQAGGEKDKSACAIINVDDPWGMKLYEWVKNQSPSFNAISLGKKGGFKIQKINPLWEGYSAQLEYQGRSYLMQTRLIGNFNIYNLAMAFCALHVMDYEPELALSALGCLEGAPGRMEVYRLETGGMIVVDYAHTPDALLKALETIRELNPRKLKVVFGCGGDRDQAKRPAMGQIAEDFADEVVITNDNPRSENPQKIILQIQSGMKKNNHTIEPDRRKAIEDAAFGLGEGEVLLVAGKGHEDYQVLPEGRIHFSDREIALELSRKIIPETRERN